MKLECEKKVILQQKSDDLELLNTDKYKQTAMKLHIGNTILKYMGLV